MSATVLTGTNGAPTKWIPLPTPGPSIASCSGNIYNSGATLLAFDPFFGHSLVPDAQGCLPTEVTSWWDKVGASAGTSISLGPTFVCPAAYTTATAISRGPQNEQVLCCPSDYDLLVAMTNTMGFPTQCVSRMNPGQTLSLVTIIGTTAKSTSMTVGSTTLSIYAIPVNGYNFATGISSTSTTSSAASSGTVTSQTTTNTTPSTTSTSTTTGADSGTSNNTTSGPGIALPVGVSVSVTVALIALAAIGFFFWRKRNKRQKAQKEGAPAGPGSHGGEGYPASYPASEVQYYQPSEGPHGGPGMAYAPYPHHPAPTKSPDSAISYHPGSANGYQQGSAANYHPDSATHYQHQDSAAGYPPPQQHIRSELPGDSSIHELATPHNR